MKNRLKVLRAERDWTQADLASALDVSRQTVNAIETGKLDRSLPLPFRAARLFGAAYTMLRIRPLRSPDTCSSPQKNSPSRIALRNGLLLTEETASWLCCRAKPVLTKS